jgi:hypothetical protein
MQHLRPLCRVARRIHTPANSPQVDKRPPIGFRARNLALAEERAEMIDEELAQLAQLGVVLAILRKPV